MILHVFHLTCPCFPHLNSCLQFIVLHACHLHVQNERKGHMITDLHAHVDLPVNLKSCLPGGACRVDRLAVDCSVIRTEASARHVEVAPP